MPIPETQGLSGRLTIELREPDGRVVLRRCHDNLITNAGRKLVAQLFTGEVAGKPEFAIAVGDNNNGEGNATPGDTQLKNKIDKQTAHLESIRLVSENSEEKAVAVVAATFKALASGHGDQTLREAGILITVASQQDVLYNHVTFPAITRTANLEMTLTWEVTF